MKIYLLFLAYFIISCEAPSQKNENIHFLYSSSDTIFFTDLHKHAQSILFTKTIKSILKPQESGSEKELNATIEKIKRKSQDQGGLPEDIQYSFLSNDELKWITPLFSDDVNIDSVFYIAKGPELNGIRSFLLSAVYFSDTEIKINPFIITFNSEGKKLDAKLLLPQKLKFEVSINSKTTSDGNIFDVVHEDVWNTKTDQYFIVVHKDFVSAYQGYNMQITTFDEYSNPYEQPPFNIVEKSLGVYKIDPQGKITNEL